MTPNMRYQLPQPDKPRRGNRQLRTVSVKYKKLNNNAINFLIWFQFKPKFSKSVISSHTSKLTFTLSAASELNSKLTLFVSSLLLLSATVSQLYSTQSHAIASPVVEASPLEIPVSVKQLPNSEESDQIDSSFDEPSTESLEQDSPIEELPDSEEELLEESSKQSVDKGDDLPLSDNNPLIPAGDSLDTLLQKTIKADLWQQMKGELPCVDATTECIARLQEIATQQNPLLVEIDTRIEEISTKIEEAKAANKKSIDLSVLRPAARVFLEPSFDKQPSFSQRRPGTVEKIAQIFTSPVGVINEVLKAVGIPLFDKLFGGGSEENQQRAIAISDLQVKLAEIQRGRAELANQVKEKVALAVFDFDTSRREFQISTEIAKREASRMQLLEVDYKLGQGDSVIYLGQLSSLDRNKAATWRSWAGMRSQLEKIKLLVLGAPD